MSRLKSYLSENPYLAEAGDVDVSLEGQKALANASGGGLSGGGSGNGRPRGITAQRAGVVQSKINPYLATQLLSNRMSGSPATEDSSQGLAASLLSGPKTANDWANAATADQDAAAIAEDKDLRATSEGGDADYVSAQPDSNARIRDLIGYDKDTGLSGQTMPALHDETGQKLLDDHKRALLAASEPHRKVGWLEAIGLGMLGIDAHAAAEARRQEKANDVARATNNIASYLSMNPSPNVGRAPIKIDKSLVDYDPISKTVTKLYQEELPIKPDVHEVKSEGKLWLRKGDSPELIPLMIKNEKAPSAFVGPLGPAGTVTLDEARQAKADEAQKSLALVQGEDADRNTWVLPVDTVAGVPAGKPIPTGRKPAPEGTLADKVDLRAAEAEATAARVAYNKARADVSQNSIAASIEERINQTIAAGGKPSADDVAELAAAKRADAAMEGRNSYLIQAKKEYEAAEARAQAMRDSMRGGSPLPVGAAKPVAPPQQAAPTKRYVNGKLVPVGQ